MNSEKSAVRFGLSILLLVTCACIVLTILKFSQSFFTPVLLAFLLTMIGAPIVRKLVKKRVPRSLAVLITVFLSCLVSVIIVVVGIFMINELETKLDKYKELSKEKAEKTLDLGVSWIEKSDTLRKKLEGLVMPDPLVVDLDKQAEPPQLEQANQSSTEEIKEQLTLLYEQAIDDINLESLFAAGGGVFNLGKGVIGVVATFFGVAFMTIILYIFMLSEASDFQQKFALLKKNQGPKVDNLLKGCAQIQDFLIIKACMSALTGVLAGTLCAVLGLDFALLWGILAFALNFIPVIGSVMASIPPFLLALVVFNPTIAFVVLGGYVLINVAIGNGVEPLITGKKLGLSTVAVVISVLFWGFIWGGVGMLMAVPLTMMVKALLEDSEDFQWVAQFLSNAKAEDIEEDSPDSELVEPSKA